MLAFIADWLRPVSDFHTRAFGALLAAVIWISLIALTWRHRGVRIALLVITAAGAIFALLPGRKNRDVAALRVADAVALRRYMGARYYWGGESPKGIDCSGLIRLGMIDALFLRGIASADPGMVRDSVWIWWHDCSAADFGSGHGFASRIFEAPSLNTVDYSKMELGDLAVTWSGNHILAYTGSNSWIEADIEEGKVIAVTAPSKNEWFQGRMRIVRWNILR